VDRTVDATATGKLCIGRIHNRVHLLLRNISLND
jgi:hypothetical protein